MAAAVPAPPPILPVAKPSSVAAASSEAAAGTDASAAAASPALRRFISRLNDSLRRGLAEIRPWSELLDRSAFSKPDSLSDATSRLRRNFAYFRVNYVAVVAFALAASLLAHPVSLAVLLALLAAWCFLYLFRASDQPLVLLGRTFNDRETLLGLVVFSVLVVFLTSVGSLIISALLIGIALVAAHGAFRVPEDLFLDEPDQAVGAGSGLLSFLGGGGGAAGGRI